MGLDGRSSELCVVGEPDHGGALVRGGEGKKASAAGARVHRSTRGGEGRREWEGRWRGCMRGRGGEAWGLRMGTVGSLS
jgi:hypothetical protein